MAEGPLELFDRLGVAAQVRQGEALPVGIAGASTHGARHAGIDASSSLMSD
jgi:hypothetical protein